MAVVLGKHPPATGDPPQPWGSVGDRDMPSEYQRWEIPIAGTNQTSQGIIPLEAPLEWHIRGGTVINRSTKTMLLKFGYETAIGDLQTEADVQVDPYKVVNFPVYKQRIDQISFQIPGPVVTEVGSIELILVPIYLPYSIYDITPVTGVANSFEVYANTALATAGDTGVLPFVNDITSVTLCADFAVQNVPDLSAMEFYLGSDITHMTGPITLLGGEKVSIAGAIGA